MDVVDHQRLPWSNKGSEQALWRACVVIMLLLLASVSVLVTSYVVPEKNRAELEALPPQLARLVKKTAPVKPAPTPKAITKEAVKKPKPVVKPKALKTPPKTKPKSSVKAKPKKLTQTKKSTKQQISKAREVARSSGVLALQSQMSALSTAVSTAGFASSNDSKNVKAKGAASVSTANAESLNAMASNQADNNKTLGLVDTTLARNSVVQLEERDEERALAIAEQNRGLTRNEDEVDLVVEGLRSTYRLLYKRALRDDPFLEGTLILTITIGAQGEVSSVDIVSNTLSDKTLLSKLIARMKLTNFGESKAKDFQKTLTFDFIPS